MGWRDIIAVHPAANLFPMMSDEELAKLGEDIKANGLTSPVVLTPDRQLIDGRNRLEACERIGVKIRSGALQPISIDELPTSGDTSIAGRKLDGSHEPAARNGTWSTQADRSRLERSRIRRGYG